MIDYHLVKEPRAVPFLVALGLALLLDGPQIATGTEEFDFFERKIRPVLVEHCYPCHSAASEKLKGGLRLDTKAGMLNGGESGQPAITPGAAGKSRLIEAIRYQNEDLQMPPPKKGKLSDAQIADFEAWINQGAPDPRIHSGPPTLNSQPATKQHWSFLPPQDHPLPSVKLKSWPQSPIDHFILAKLESHGLRPSPPAGKRTLIRRATYDLTGLPPTFQEMEAFLRDETPEAFARVVDRLLASPHYGERWARHWLDVARYSDTKGYVYSDREEPRFVHAHAYRDWVIRAFNEDLPYDRFLLHQIAGDRLAEAGDRSGLAAMGFLTLGRRFLGVVHDIIDDRIDVLTRSTLGLTVACARCHDHKYDPIPTQDYYSLYGVFQGSSETMTPLIEKPARTAEYLEYEKGLLARTDKLNQTFQRKCDELSDRLRAKTADYLVAVLKADELPTEEFYSIRGPDDLNPVIVRQWQAYLFETRKRFHPVFQLWHAFAALPEKEFAPRAAARVREFETSAQTNPPGTPINPVVIETFSASPPSTMKEAAQTYGKLLAGVYQKWRTAQTNAVAAHLPSTNTAAATPITHRSSPIAHHGSTTTNHESRITNPLPPIASLPNPHEEEIRQVLYAPGAPVNVPPGPIVDLEWFFEESSRVEMNKLQADIDRWIIQSPGAIPHAVMLEDRPSQKNPRVFARGNPANKGVEVPRQFLGLLAGPDRRPFQIGSGRLELSRAIASPDNPLTARVMVNRIWLHHFGAGLVQTPSDFGTRSAPPSHPELLDWLARRFMAEGWSIKTLHRLMMVSSTYQQSSEESAPSLVDPENRLRWRMNRQRLDFESMRDALLAASGELDLSLGGRPTNLFGKALNPRRTVYGFIDRQFLPGTYRVFDFANPDLHSPQRYTTTVPQQALFFMNSGFLAGRARALNHRPDVASIAKPETRIRQLYRHVFQREPTAGQVAAGVRFLKMAETEPFPEPPKPVTNAWQYGYGEFDESAGRVKEFAPLPHFTGEAWQGGPAWPDAKLGWVQLTASGGHAGNDLQHAAIRRWTAPHAAVVSIAGTARHEHQEGDGIRARIVSSRGGLLGTWVLHNHKAEAKADAIEVQRGDTLDFIVDYGANLNSDMFKWAPVIKAAQPPDAAPASDYAAEWNAGKEFSGPPEPPAKALSAWEQYAQVLLLANEFLFLD